VNIIPVRLIKMHFLGGASQSVNATDLSPYVTCHHVTVKLPFCRQQPT